LVITAWRRRGELTMTIAIAADQRLIALPRAFLASNRRDFSFKINAMQSMLVGTFRKCDRETVLSQFK
jgi:hypothetical protein